MISSERNANVSGYVKKKKDKFKLNLVELRAHIGSEIRGLL